MSKIGIIGGSGIYKIDGVELIGEHQAATPFGDPSDCILEVSIAGQKAFFIPRHGRQHSLLPHEVNYRANIFALKEMGVKYLLSLSAVGSFRDECPPETFVCPDQFIDWTKGGRARSFFGSGMVGHVSVANPVDEKLRALLVKSCQSVGVACHDGGTYLCIEGPQFSTRAESAVYRGLGATVIGMTNVPESYLAKEAGMAYATVAMVTDFDCWKERHCSVDEIMKTMNHNNQNACRLLKHAIPALAANRFEVETENAVALMTPQERLSSEQAKVWEVLSA